MQTDIYLPPDNYARQLYFDERNGECRLVALQGIHALVKMYAGRGGSIHPDRLFPEMRDKLGAYLDILYWLAIRENSVSDALFYALQLQRTKRYDAKGFDGLFQHVSNRVESHTKKVYRLFMTCGWTGAFQLQENWQHLFENIAHEGRTYLGFKHRDITFILLKEAIDVDYYVVLWGTTFDTPLEKTIFLRTEPVYPEKVNIGGKCTPNSQYRFLRFFDYEDSRYPNTAENWLGRREEKLRIICAKKEDYVVSTVLSDKYIDPGHKLRVDFMKFAVSRSAEFMSETAPKFHVFGYNNNFGFPDDVYRGPLPPNDKSGGLFGYKYTLTAENQSIPGYFTEKIIDGILSECLVFYWGCPNLEDILGVSGASDDDIPFVRLPMDDLEKSFKLIYTALLEGWWEKRIQAIRLAKKRIFERLMLKHRLIDVLQQEQFLSIYGEDGRHVLRLIQATKPGRYDTRMFPIIYYNGVRLQHYSTIAHDYGVTIKDFQSQTSKLPNGIPLVQEFSNESPRDPELQSFTINHSRFTIRGFAYPKPPKTFVLNMDNRPDRMKQFSKNFPKDPDGKPIWKYERFRAIDGSAMASAPGGWSDDIKHLFRGNDFGMKPGVVGCALSHLQLWKMLEVDEENDQYLIFEDDVEFTDSYSWKLYNALQLLPHGWDMVFPGHLVCYEQTTDHRTEGELPRIEFMSRYIVPKRTSWVGTASYFISKRGAKKLLKFIDENGINYGIDYLIQLRFADLLHAYGMRPMLNFAGYPSPLNPDVDVNTDIQK